MNRSINIDDGLETRPSDLIAVAWRLPGERSTGIEADDDRRSDEAKKHA